MKIKSGIATVKATGQKFEYAVKLSWNKKYFTCDMNPEIPDACAPWFPKLGEAKAHAEQNGYLVAA